MANLIIKPSTGGSLKLQEDGGTDAISINTSGVATIANATISAGTATLSNATLADASITKTDAFVAKMSGSGWTTYGSGVILPFDDVSGNNFNNSSCFNTTTYKYTAPVAGSYNFYFTIYTANSDTANGFKFMKNDSNLDIGANDFTFDEHGNEDHTINASVVLVLSATNTVSVYTSTPSDVNRNIACFGGCRIR